MKQLLVSKPLMGLVAILLIVQIACVASSISPTAAPGSASSKSTQAASTQPSTGSQSTQSSPFTGGAQNTQSAPAPAGGQSTQAAPTTSGQATQGIPSTGGQATQSMPTTPAAGGNATAPATAQALLGQVAQHYQSAGRDQALKDFTDKTAPFDSPDMFVMCIGSDHKITAMGGFPLLVGVSADSLSQVTGQAIGSLIWDAASLQPQGSLPFQWKNPLTNAAESKVIYYQKLSQDVCGVVANQP